MWKAVQQCEDAFSAKVMEAATLQNYKQAEWELFLVGARSSQSRATRGFLAPLSEARCLELMSDAFELRPNGQHMSGRQILTRWDAPGVATLSCLVLPLALALVVAHGHWGCLMFSAHSVMRRPRLFSQPRQVWPPREFWAEAKTKRFVDTDAAIESDLTTTQLAKRMRTIANNLRSWLPACLDGMDESEDHAGVSLSAQSHI